MTDVNNQDPLEVILVDSVKKQDLAKELLASILKGHAEIESKTGVLELLPATYDLSVADRILILLCGRLAQKLLATKLSKKESDFDEKVSQKEISAFLVTSDPGTIKASLHNLRDKNLIKNENGKNFITPSHLQKIHERLYLKPNVGGSHKPK